MRHKSYFALQIAGSCAYRISIGMSRVKKSNAGKSGKQSPGGQRHREKRRPLLILMIVLAERRSGGLMLYDFVVDQAAAALDLFNSLRLSLLISLALDSISLAKGHYSVI